MKSSLKNLFAGSFVSLFFLGSCGEDLPPLSLLKDVRVASAQFYVAEQSALNFPSVAKIPPQNCQVWADNLKYCQQYPVRPSTKSFLKFTLISPEGITPTFNIENLTQLKVTGGSSNTGGSGNSAVISSSTQSTQVPVTRFSLVKNTQLSRVIGNGPMRIEEVVFEFTTPTATDLLSDALDGSSLSLPLFDVRYKSSGTEADNGFVNFTVIPDSEDNVFWNGITNSEQAQNSAREVASLRAQSRTNVPPQIGNLLPALGTALGSKNTLEFSVLRPDPDEGAKSRVQWYTTRGEFVNQNAKKTTWNSKDSGNVGVFAVVRDLQGGSDTIYGNFLP